MKRPASHAGSWYSDNQRKLDEELNLYIKESIDTMEKKGISLPIQDIKAIIAPHAGYAYSGSTSAFAYSCFDPKKINRVFILGPSHVSATRKCLLSRCEQYETPLGNLSLDRSVIDKLESTGLFSTVESDVEIQEHSIEMHLPFVYKAFEGNAIKIVPIIVGHLDKAREREYAKVIAPYLQAPDTLCIISSDFCHWGGRFGYTYYNQTDDDEQAVSLSRSIKHPIGIPIYKSIESLDRRGISIINSLNNARFSEYLEATENTICGRYPISLVLACLHEFGSDWSLFANDLAYAQSSHCKHPKDSSVSYASLYIKATLDFSS